MRVCGATDERTGKESERGCRNFSPERPPGGEQGSPCLATAPRRGTGNEGEGLGFLRGFGGLYTLVSRPRGQPPRRRGRSCERSSPEGTRPRWKGSLS